MISGLNSRTYEGKLKELDIWSLEKRRVMFDLVQMYKVAHNIGNISCSVQLTGQNPGGMTP